MIDIPKKIREDPRIQNFADRCLEWAARVGPYIISDKCYAIKLAQIRAEEWKAQIMEMEGYEGDEL